MPYFGQEIFLKAQEKGPLTTPAYREALDKCRRLSRAEGLDAVLDQHRLDALVAPTGAPGVGHRPGERRPLRRRQLDARGGLRLPVAQPADGLRVRAAGRALVLRPRLERARARQARLRLRAGDPPPPPAALPAHGRSRSIRRLTGAGFANRGRRRRYLARVALCL